MDSLKRILMMGIATLLATTSSQLKALDIETLLMPGEVIEGHAKLETECSQCHARFSKATQTQLCLDCHEDIDRDIDGATGYHGRIDDIAATPCKSCHSDHLGRDANIVGLDPLVFDHKRTDFSLKGAHTVVACSACHATGKKYAEATSSCNSCHGKQDPHQGNLGDECHSCHTSKSWKKFDFDHGKTDFPLHGAHRSTACNTCHINERYENTSKTCNACHALDDAHNGINGPQCADCHNEQTWTESKFDHDKDTDFRLKGRHADTRCKACHKDPVKDKKPATSCVACHRSDDAHHGRYGKKCQTCHSESRWKKSRFDHQRSTDFALQGKHRKLSCNTCHRDDLYKENLPVECLGCHQSDDVHEGQQGKQCQRCHQASGWEENIVFDHDLTRFPLLGLHATAPCEECHLSSAFKNTERECISCHRNDDEHEATLGTECHSCHNPNSWSVWIFDHNEQTDYELQGAHSDLRCNNCHKRPSKGSVSQSRQCNVCHRQDDIHQGRFGADCTRCHTTEDFRDVQFNN